MVSVVIPALNEEDTIAAVVTFALSEPLVEEAIVVDDASVDNTAACAEAAGAVVIQSTLLGKGASMLDGVRAAHFDCILFLDGDLRGLEPGFIDKLAGPVLRREADFVKANFSRRAGRVTILTARPLLQSFFPELARFGQPLGGIYCVRRSLLLQLRFENDYGVDIGLLIDAFLLGAKLAEMEIGGIEHDSQSLEQLGRMADQVLRVILERALAAGRLDAELLAETREVERHMHAGLENQVKLNSERRPVVVFALDGVLLQGALIAQLAARTGRITELTHLQQMPATLEERLKRTVAVFRDLPRQAIEDAAMDIPLNPEALNTIKSLRRAGYRVCIVSGLFYAAVEVIRRRLYAEMCFSHLTKRTGPETRTGALKLSPAFQHPLGCEKHLTCNSNVLLHLQERYALMENQVIAVGLWPQDRCLLLRAGRGIAFNAVDHPDALGLKGSLEGKLESIVDLCN